MRNGELNPFHLHFVATFYKYAISLNSKYMYIVMTKHRKCLKILIGSLNDYCFSSKTVGVKFEWNYNKMKCNSAINQVDILS